MKIPSALAAAFAVAYSSTLTAATVTWTAGGDGNIGDPTKYAGGVAPVDGDTVASDGAGSIIGFDNTNTGLSLAALNLNLTSGATAFNQTAGTFTVATLGFGGGGGTRNPAYTLSGGTLNVTTAFNWGNGSTASFTVSGGTFNQSAGTLNLGVAGGAHGRINISSGAFNHNSTAQIGLGTTSSGKGTITMTGGTFTSATTALRLGNANDAGSVGTIDMSNNASFTANSATTVYLGNNSGTGVLTLANSASFSVSAAAISVGQSGTRSGTINMSGTSSLVADRLVLGGDNAASGVTGVINLNGGTISAKAIQLGASNVTPSATQNVLHANGGTVKVVFDATRNANFFGRNDGSNAGTQGLYVDLQAGGLKFDTNGNATTITAGTTITGAGDFVKQGAGSLTIFGAKTYEGATVIEGGSIVLGNSNVFADASDLVLDGGTLALADFSDAFATLSLESTSTIDFGTLLGGSNTLTFADSSAVTWSGTLIITNFNMGEDVLNFSPDGLTSAQLDAISIAGYTGKLGLDDLGNVVAVPEPAEVSLAIAAGLGLLAFARRRRAIRG